MFIIPQANKVFLSSVFVYCLWQHKDFPVPRAILLSGGLPEIQLHFNLLYAKALLPISSSLCWTFPLSPCSRIWVTLESLTKLLLAPEERQSHPLCLLPSGVSSSLPFLWHPQSLFNQAPFHLTTYIVAFNTVFNVGFLGISFRFLGCVNILTIFSVFLIIMGSGTGQDPSVKER